MPTDPKADADQKKRERAETAEAGLDAAKETVGLLADWAGATKLLVAAAVIGGAAGTIGGVVGGGASGAAVTALSDPAPPVMVPLDAGTTLAAAELAPKLRVESTPAGATLLVDGTASGTTPAELEPSVGPHRLELSADGYVPYQVDVEIREGIASQVSVSLRPESEEPAAATGGGGLGRAGRRRRCNDQLSRCRDVCHDSTSYCRDRECSLSDSGCQARCDSMERMCREQCSAQFSACAG